MQRPPGSDAALVAAMAAGDPAGLDGAYRRYADRLFSYARSIVGDADAAADVVQETFLLASQRVRQLRDPDRLGSWLYTIARNESRRWIRSRKRTTALGDADEPVLDTDPGRAMQAQQVRELVRAAAGGLGEADREVFELTVRHGLSPLDLAGVLGVSTNHAHARMSRARTQFEGALGALLLARSGRERCATLAGMLKGWDGKLTVLLRKRIDRHARDCDVCGQERRDRMRPAELLAAYSALPFLAMAQPAGTPAAPATQLLPRANAVQEKPARDGVRRATVAGGVAILVLLAVGVAVGLSRNLLFAQPSGSPSPVAISGSPDGGGLVAPTVAGSVTPTSRPSTAVVTPTTVIIVPFTASGSVQVASCSSSVRMWQFEATVSGGTLKSATLHYLSTSAAMTISGNKANVTRSLSVGTPQVTWWVVATATDGRTAETPHVTSQPCP
jgi:RNA polymerase sigma factor (sigma-70 family)